MLTYVHASSHSFSDIRDTVTVGCRKRYTMYEKGSRTVVPPYKHMHNTIGYLHMAFLVQNTSDQKSRAKWVAGTRICGYGYLQFRVEVTAYQVYGIQLCCVSERNQALL